MKAFLREMALSVLIVRELLAFFWERRLWWLLPLVAVLVLFGLVFAFASASGLGPLHLHAFLA